MIRTPGIDRHPDAARARRGRARRDAAPARLGEFVGQDELKEQLAVSIAAVGARRRARPRAARRAARPRQDQPGPDRGRGARRPVRPDRRPGARAQGRHRVLPHRPRAARVFFVDEIHRLPRAVEETFYPAMEDRQLPITLGVGPGAKVVTLDLPPFTLIGATTRAGPAHRRRCATASASSTGSSTTRRASSRGSSCAAPACSASAIDAARGARDRRPRARHAARRQPAAQARARLRRGPRRRRDRRDGRGAALDLLGVDHEGLDRLDREILATICERFSGGPVGLSTLAVAVGEEADTIEDVYEPYLLQRGFLQRTPRGRCATAARVPASRPRAAGQSRRAVLAHARSSAGRKPAFSRDPITLTSEGMAHLFICPNCGQRTTRDRPHAPGSATSRRAARSAASASCSSCSTTTTRRPNAAFFVCDQQGRVIGCGRGSRELTGLSDEKVIGRPVHDVLGLTSPAGRTTWASCWSGACASWARTSSVNAEGDLPQGRRGPVPRLR